MTDIPEVIARGETLTVEFKAQWNERALETLAAFANTEGGTLLVGVDDDGCVNGWPGDDQDLSAIVNQIVETLRITPRITIADVGGRRLLLVEVRAGEDPPVTCRGRYYQRIGNSTRELPAAELGRFFLRRSGASWDLLPADATLDAIDPAAVAAFLSLAGDRLPGSRPGDPAGLTLEKLGLVREGRPTRGALLLFGRDPQRLFPATRLHLGRFGRDAAILDDHELSGTLFSLLGGAVQVFSRLVPVRFGFRTELRSTGCGGPRPGRSRCRPFARP